MGTTLGCTIRKAIAGTPSGKRLRCEPELISVGIDKRCKLSPWHGLRLHGDLHAISLQIPAGDLDVRAIKDDGNFDLLPIGHHGLGIEDQHD
jgi:hypothetical protein